MLVHALPIEFLKSDLSLSLKLGTRLNIVSLRKIAGDCLVLFERGSRVGISKISLHEQQTEFFCGRIENAHLKTKSLCFF